MRGAIPIRHRHRWLTHRVRSRRWGTLGVDRPRGDARIKVGIPSRPVGVGGLLVGIVKVTHCPARQTGDRFEQMHLYRSNEMFKLRNRKREAMARVQHDLPSMLLPSGAKCPSVKTSRRWDAGCNWEVQPSTWPGRDSGMRAPEVGEIPIGCAEIAIERRLRER